MEKITRIIFLCTGNVCRSPMAWGFGRREAEQRGLDVVLESAGSGACVGELASRNALTASGEVGVDISAHRARQMTAELDAPETLYAVMSWRHAKWLQDNCSVPAERIAVLGDGVPDPFGMSLDVYRETCAALEKAVHELFDRFEPLMPKKAAALIRRMTAEDIPVVSQMENDCFTDPWSAQSFAEETENPQADALSAEYGGVLCGYACMISGGGVSEIANICVAPEYRRRGVGKKLMDALEEAAVLRGSDELTLEVRVSNDAAKKLYEKLGFVSLGIRPDFYSSPREDALIMTKKLILLFDKRL